MQNPKLFSHQILQCTWSGLGLIAISLVSELWEGIVRKTVLLVRIKGLRPQKQGVINASENMYWWVDVISHSAGHHGYLLAWEGIEGVLLLGSYLFRP